MKQVMHESSFEKQLSHKTASLFVDLPDAAHAEPEPLLGRRHREEPQAQADV